MTITATVICDSVNPHGTRITTMQLRYPRFIHSEFMTHRMFSHNASSSRAIPVERLIQNVINDPVFPSYWGKNQKGMSASTELVGDDKELAVGLWNAQLEEAICTARDLAAVGAHKQIVNRILEPFSHINVVVTATDWKNFGATSLCSDAQPEMWLLAHSMFLARKVSPPKTVPYGEWHLPFVQGDEHELDISDKQILSVARCASVSYRTVEGTIMDLHRAKAIFEKLHNSCPKHMSPFEHQAQARRHPLYFGNFRSWCQFRKMIQGEIIREE